MEILNAQNCLDNCSYMDLQCLIFSDKNNKRFFEVVFCSDGLLIKIGNTTYFRDIDKKDMSLLRKGIAGKIEVVIDKEIGVKSYKNITEEIDGR